MAVSFTGGKDCTLTVHLVSRMPGYRVTQLVTFCPEDKPFLSHPQALIAAQAKCLGIPHNFCIVKAPYLDAYCTHISGLSKQNIRFLATGDMLDAHGTFMEDACEPTEVGLLRPLWMRDRREVIGMIYDNDISFMVTCCSLKFIPMEVARKLVGQILTEHTHREVINGELSDIDPCGEYGEYHTMVLDAPLFKKRLVVDAGRQVVTEDGAFLVYDVEKFRIVDKVVL